MRCVSNAAVQPIRTTFPDAANSVFRPNKDEGTFDQVVGDGAGKIRGFSNDVTHGGTSELSFRV